MSGNHSLWLVVADASRAWLLCCSEDLRRAEVVDRFEHPESRSRGADLKADDWRRTQPRRKGAARRAALAYPTSPHEIETHKFSREVADRLRLGRARNLYRELVLLAPPEFLGLLRDALDVPTAECVRASIAKNCTAERTDAILERVRRELLAGSPG